MPFALYLKPLPEICGFLLRTSQQSKTLVDVYSVYLIKTDTITNIAAMKILNPIYDIAFKYLMENEVFAKKILSVILDKEVVDLALSQQETVMHYEKRALKLFRLDFKATIREADGSERRVLIELQKSKQKTDMERFRYYLASNYMPPAEGGYGPEDGSFILEDGTRCKPFHPIVAIYILGYNLDDLPYMAVSVNRDIIDSVSKKKLNVKSFFIEHLTHEAHILQVRRLPEKPKTELEKFMLLFNQAWCTNYGFILDLQVVPDEFKDIAQYLQSPLLEEKVRRMLMAEDELETIFDEHEAKLYEALNKTLEAEKREKAALREKDKALKVKDNALKVKAMALKEKDRALKQTEAILQQKEVLALKFARQMIMLGSTTQEVAIETGLPEHVIDGLRQNR